MEGFNYGQKKPQGIPLFSCIYCGQTFHDLLSMYQHEIGHRASGRATGLLRPPGFCCGVCGSRFDTPAYRSQHQQSCARQTVEVDKSEGAKSGKKGRRQFLSSGYETSDAEGSVVTQVPLQTLPSVAYIDWDAEPSVSPETTALLGELVRLMGQQPTVVYMDYIYLAVEFGENQKQHWSAANLGAKTDALFIRGGDDLWTDDSLWKRYGDRTVSVCQTRIVAEDAAPDEAGDLVVCWLRPEATELVQAITATIRKRMTFREFVYEVIRPLKKECKLVVASTEDRELVEDFDCEGGIYLF